MFRPTIPRKLRVSEYFTWVLLVCCFVVAVQDLRLGLAYSAAALATLLPLRVFRIPREVYYTVFMAAGTIWLTHLVRPLVLMAQPESFLYPRIISFASPLATTTLLTVAGMALAMLSGLAGGYRLFLRQRATQDTTAEREPMLVRMRAPLNVILLVVIALKAVGVVWYGVGLRGNPVPILTVTSLLAPDLLIQGILILYLLRYRSMLGMGQQWFAGGLLVAMAVIGLLQGSKAFVLQLLLALFIYFLAFRGDFSVRVRHAAVLGMLGLVTLAVSFPTAMSLRRYVQENGYDTGAVGAAIEGITQSTRAEDIGIMTNRVTSRLLGFDGLIATQASLPPEFVQIFAFTTTAARVRGRFLPWEAGAGSLTSGRAISTFLFGHPEELRHSGGIGLFAVSRLMAGPIGAYVVVFLFGLACAAYFSAIERVPSTDSRFVLRYAGAYGLILLTMSGNADFILPTLIVTVTEVLILRLLLRHVYVAIR